ncbi:hypothetical protein BaRGS_00026755 [Batillaria attramentaria]|uniref:BTB domain-containing protein n=1 Tax=Batillaria attramentaria TaxID=370345 RepID=A0ABD0K564_9CAEN
MPLYETNSENHKTRELPTKSTKLRSESRELQLQLPKVRSDMVIEVEPISSTMGLSPTFLPSSPARLSVLSHSSEVTKQSFNARSSSLSIDDDELDLEGRAVVRLNVGGTLFTTTRDVLQRYPNTLLGSREKIAPYYNRVRREYFFDRNPHLFAAILDLYRTHELHLPRNLCGNSALKELEFWEVPAVWVAGCCWTMLHCAIQDRRLYKDLRFTMESGGSSRADAHFLRYKIWKFFGGSLVDMVVLGVLILEVLLKIICCPDISKYRTPCNVLYTISLLVCVCAHVVYDYYVKIVGRHPALRVMWIAIQRNLMELTLLVIVVFGLAVLFGAMAFFLELWRYEGFCDDSNFAYSLSGAIYWAIITMSTVGYGDITPCTPAARVVGIMCAVTGVIALAMPVAVLTQSFNEYYARQEVNKEKLKSQELYFKLPSVRGSDPSGDDEEEKESTSSPAETGEPNVLYRSSSW